MIVASIMGIINVTPDSFYEGSRVQSARDCAGRAAEMLRDGATWVDIGGESTRPGSQAVSLQEELDRVLPVVEIIKNEIDIKISIDTRKSVVAREAIRLGATMVNDVSGFEHDPEMAGIVAASKVLGVIMHSRGEPDTMQNQTTYSNFIIDVKNELETRIASAIAKGVKREQIILDPGFGFAKTNEQNHLLLQKMVVLKNIGYPLMIGLSRKKFIGRLTGEENPENRLIGSLAATSYLLCHQDISYIRTHDVKETAQLCRVHEVLKGH